MSASTNREAPAGRAAVPAADWRVDPTSPVPLYFQLSESIRKWLDTTARAGDRVAAEEQLAEQLNISRATVRKAIERLEAEGLLYRRRGMGTFVATPRLNRELRLTSSALDIVTAGKSARTRLLRREVHEAGETIAERLQVEPSARVLELERLRLADNSPVALLRNWVPFAAAPALETADLEARTLYEVLQQDCDIVFGHAHQKLQAMLPSDQEATHLGMAPADPVMRVLRQTEASDGRIIEWSDCLYPGDQAEFVVRLEP
jgi:GntR family transcriptional regulator